MPINNKEDSLLEQVQGLELIIHGLNDLILNSDNADEIDSLRLRRTRVRQLLFTKQAQLDAVRAMSVIPPLTDAERDTVTAALSELDRFVIADQEVHVALSLLTQIANRISNA
jgi:hypothetical protein